MTFEARVAAVEAFGFTPRQAGFLVTVMLHAGVCLLRHYCAWSRIVYGQNAREFARRLVADGFATTYDAAQKGARLYHLQHKALYAAIGDPDSRHRKPMALPRAVERLMVLDAVLIRRDVSWLATEQEKLAHFTTMLGTRLPRAHLPQLRFGSPPDETVRFFPDRLPIGVQSDGRTTVFLYLVTRAAPVDFRAFLHRHAALLGVLPAWTLRLLAPPHLGDASTRFLGACHDTLANPVRLSTLDEVRWYFETCRRLATEPARAQDARFQRAQQAFGSPRFRALYRAWLRQGDAVLDEARSPLLEDALAHGSGQVEWHVLAHRYLHLGSLVGTA